MSYYTFAIAHETALARRCSSPGGEPDFRVPQFPDLPIVSLHYRGMTEQALCLSHDLRLLLPAMLAFRKAKNVWII